MSKRVIDVIKKGGIGILPTDTLYGLVGSALNKKTVERIYKVRKRNPKKPLIILISHIDDLQGFGIKDPPKALESLWPNKVTVILPCPQKRFEYLHRGTKSLAFRLPKHKALISFLEKTGPLVAPSANPEGKDPALTIPEAKRYFGDSVDFYASKGRLVGSPSTIVEYKKGKWTLLREGAVDMKAWISVEGRLSL